MWGEQRRGDDLVAGGRYGRRRGRRTGAAINAQRCIEVTVGAQRCITVAVGAQPCAEERLHSQVIRAKQPQGLENIFFGDT